MKAKIVLKNRKKRYVVHKAGPGNMAGLAKEIAEQIGDDPGFFTKCMACDAVAKMDDDYKKRVCAAAHKLITGHWPAQDVSKKAISKRPDVTPADKKRAVAEYGNVTYADEKNKKYPLDNEEHIRSAWSYIHMPRDSAKYSSEEVKAMEAKIVTAWKKVIDKAGPDAAATKKKA